MSLIKIFKKDESTILIEANPIIIKELSSYFSVKAANYRFAPLYKQGLWSGDIRYFNTKENSLPIGLIEKVYEFARLGNYSIECTFERFNKISKVDFIKFVDSLSLPFKCRDYQIEAAYEACCKKNLNIHISTAGGKSLVMYIVCRFMYLQNLQTLIVLPNQGLVEQIYKDFADYGWNVEYKVHRLYSGQTKVFELPVIAACWQSLYRNKDLHKRWDCLIIDEAQGAAGKSLSDIGKWCTSAQYRFGFSGTFPDPATADWFSIVGSLGPIKTFATYKTLQADGHIAKIKIVNIILQYPIEIKKECHAATDKNYSKENNFIYGNPIRSNFLLKTVQGLKENCLVLFTNKEAHGYKLKKLFEDELKDKTVLYVDGDVPIEKREDIRQMIGERNDIVLLATYATLSAGWNAKNIHTVLFASGSKSKIRTLQSIGRGLRLSEGKDYLKLYDFADDMVFVDKENSIKYMNYSMKHLKERLLYYVEQGWDYKVIKVKLNK